MGITLEESKTHIKATVDLALSRIALNRYAFTCYAHVITDRKAKCDSYIPAIMAAKVTKHYRKKVKHPSYNF